MPHSIKRTGEEDLHPLSLIRHRWLIPVYEEDPLLRMMDDDDDFGESEQFVTEEEIDIEKLTAHEELLNECR